jgi:hypothetical protein
MLLGGGFILATAGSGPAAAEAGDVPLLLGGPSEPARAQVAVDVSLPRGARIEEGVPRPAAGAEKAACSARYPLCVHRGEAVATRTASSALDALERAYGRLVPSVGLPPPLGDAGRGGSDALDLYLIADGTADLVTAHDDRELADFDRAAAYCVLSGAERATAGELVHRFATLCVGEAIAWRLDAGLTPDLRRAYATHLWWLVGTPTALDVQAIGDLQQHPELALATRERDELSEGRALLFEYLDTRRNVAGPGALSSGLLALAAGSTTPAAFEWQDEPDVFDVLRHSLGENRTRIATLLGDLCLARAFLGARDDGMHLPSLAFAGEFGSVRFDWVLPFSTLPRHVASRLPIEPNGAVYVEVPLDRPAGASTLGFRATWEPPVSFQWLLVRLDTAGRELSRLHLPYQERTSSVEGRIANLDGVATVVAVGTNLGDVALSQPFDPDIAPFERNRATLYFARLEP